MAFSFLPLIQKLAPFTSLLSLVHIELVIFPVNGGFAEKL